jgi:hypothetical protein
MENNNSEVKEANQLVESFNEATNGPRFGIFEQVLCSQIYQAANTADPLRQIQLITQAALMLDENKRKSLGLDIKKIYAISSVNIAFLNAIITPLPDNQKIVSFQFGFKPTDENFEKFITPWYHEETYRFHSQYIPEHLVVNYRVFYCAQCGNRVEDDREGSLNIDSESLCKACGQRLKKSAYSFIDTVFYKTAQAKREDVTNAEYTFACFQAATESGFVSLRSSFLEWAIPFVLDLLRRLTESVRPEIYNEIAKMFSEYSRETKNAV